MWKYSFTLHLIEKCIHKMKDIKTEVWTVWKQQLTSAGKSTISNWYAISGKMPSAKAKMAPAEPTIL